MRNWTLPYVEGWTEQAKELASIIALTVLLAWVRFETGRGFVDIYFDQLPRLF